MDQCDAEKQGKARRWREIWAVLNKVVREGLSDEVTLSRDLNAQEQVTWAKMEQEQRGALACWRNSKD